MVLVDLHWETPFFLLPLVLIPSLMSGKEVRFKTIVGLIRVRKKK
jgi:hypothetical protein